MKQFIILLLFCFAVSFGKAQLTSDSALTDIAFINQDSSLLSKALLFIDSSSSLSADEVLQKTFSPLATYKYRNRISPAAVPFNYFLKFFVTNKSEKEIAVYVYPGSYFKQIELYKVKQQPYPIENTGNISGYRKLTLAAGETCYVLVYLKPLKNEFNYIAPVLIREGFIKSYKQIFVRNKTDLQIYGLILSGVLFMMILFMITNFIISYKPEFLYNALYSLCMFFLIFFNSTVSRNTNAFTNFYYSYFDFFLLVTGTMFYITFIRKFLSTKSNYELLDKVLKYGELFILLLLGIYTYLNFFTGTYQPQYYLENIIKFLILIIGILLIYLAVKQRNRLFNYIAAGNAVLITFSLISLAIILGGLRPTKIYYSAIFYYNTGIVFELFFFLLGLTYKNRSELIKGIKEQEALKLDTRGRAVLKKVEDLAPVEVEEVFDGVRLVNRELAGLRFDLSGGGCGEGLMDRLLVRFLTPTELKGGGELVDRPEFGILLRRLRDRISNLRVFYQGGALEVDFEALGQAAEAVEIARCELRRVESERLSSRTGQRHSLGGFVGEVEYVGEMARFVEFLRVGAWVGVGRQTVWGKGCLEVVTTDVESGKRG